MNLNTKVSEIMSTALTAVSPTTPIAQLEKLFQRRGIHHLPVEDRNGKILGIISTDDFNRYRHSTSPVDLVAQHIMTDNPCRLSPKVPIGEALSIFLDNRFRALPVVDANDQLLGIVTPYDFLELILQESAIEEEES